jgi:hypothetical protein
MRDWLESDILLTIPASIILAIACRAKQGTERENEAVLRPSKAVFSLSAALGESINPKLNLPKAKNGALQPF